MSPSSFLSEIRLGLRAAYHGLWGRAEMVAAIPNDRGMALRSFVALLIASPWFAIERWMAYRLPVWLYIPYNPPRLVFLEIIYELQSWVMFPLVVFALTHVLGGRQNFWRFLTVSNWAALILLPLVMLADAPDMLWGWSEILVFLIATGIIGLIILMAYCLLLKLSLDVVWWRALIIMIVGTCTAMVVNEALLSVFGLPSEPFPFAV